MIETATSATLEKYRRYVLTSFLKKVQPIVIDRAEGATVWDENGKAYVDMYAGISVVNAGHCRPEVIEAAAAQMRRSRRRAKTSRSCARRSCAWSTANARARASARWWWSRR